MPPVEPLDISGVHSDPDGYWRRDVDECAAGIALDRFCARDGSSCTWECEH
jgi:hypothetical protein